MLSFTPCFRSSVISIGRNPLTAGFHSSAFTASQRALELVWLREALGVRYREIKLDTKLVLSTLRTLQCERNLYGHAEKSAFFRDGHRDIALISQDKEKISIGEIEDILPNENGVTWNTISDLAQNGKSTRLENLTEEKRAAILFNRVHGLGPKGSKEFAEQGYRTLEELVPFLQKKKKVLLAIQHFEDMECFIPHSEIAEYQTLLTKAFEKMPTGFGFQIMGSFRRGEALSSDIDLIVWHPIHRTRPAEGRGSMPLDEQAFFAQVKRVMEEAGLLFPNKYMANGPQKVMGLTKLPIAGAKWRQIDLRLCPYQSIPYMLLGNTGDDNLMKIMRREAKFRGWTLNEYNMGEKDGKKGSTSNWPLEGTEKWVKEENEIFELLAMPYLTPEQRSYRVYSKILDQRYLL